MQYQIDRIVHTSTRKINNINKSFDRNASYTNSGANERSTTRLEPAVMLCVCFFFFFFFF